jgi:predicted  nucleic acid-binding Zn-ribbon protein
MTGSDVEPSSSSLERDFFRMFWLLPRVQKQIAKLPADEREKLVDALLGPVAASRCEPVENRRRRGVFKFNVGRDIRVCFRMEGRWGVVVFIGDHYKCQRFIDRRAGSVYGRLIPIEDFVMSMSNTDNNNKSVSSPDSSPTAAVAERSQNGVCATRDHSGEISPSFSDWMGMLPGVVDRTYGQRVRQVEEACLAEMAEVTTRGESARADVTSRIETLSQRLDSRADEVTAQVATLAKSITETDQRTHSVRHDSHTRVAALAGDLAAVKSELNDRGRRATEQFESVVLELGGLSEKHDDLEHSLVQVGGWFKNFESASKASMAEMRDQLAALEVRDQAAPLVPKLARHEERLHSQDQKVEAAVADGARCLEKIASIGADMGQFKEVFFTLSRGMSDLGRSVSTLSARVESLALEQSRRDEQTIAARLTRRLERIQSVVRSRWVRVVG